MLGTVTIDSEEKEVEFPLYRKSSYTAVGGGVSTAFSQVWLAKTIVLTHDMDDEFDEWNICVGPSELIGDKDFIMGEGDYAGTRDDWLKAVASFCDFVAEELE